MHQEAGDGGQPLDLTAFLRACDLAPSIEPNFHRKLVELVVAAWHPPGKSVFGWVVAMKGGPRLYLEYTVDRVRNHTLEDLAITPLPGRQTYPTVHFHGGVHWYQPGHINAHLGLYGGTTFQPAPDDEKARHKGQVS